MEQQFVTHVAFICPRCKKTTHDRVVIPEPEWGAAEHFVDLSSEGHSVVTCHACESTFDAYVFLANEVCSVKLTDFPELAIEADDPEFWPPEEWLEAEPATDPFGVFQMALRDIDRHLDRHGDSNGGSLLNRMLFSSLIAAMEAYLADTLMHRVAVDKTALEALIKEDRELKAMKFELSEIAANPNLVTERVNAFLRSIVYHNLPRVDNLYWHALQLRVIADKDEYSRLAQAVSYRHDCVHRNGRNTEGQQLEVFTVEYIRETYSVLENFVGRIEAAFHVSALTSLTHLR